jgi:hypothetical protein
MVAMTTLKMQQFLKLHALNAKLQVLLLCRFIIYSCGLYFDSKVFKYKDVSLENIFSKKITLFNQR